MWVLYFFGVLLLKRGLFQTILITFLGFSFSGISLPLRKFVKLINDSLSYFTIMSFLIWLSSYKSLTKNDGTWYWKYSLNICSFTFFSSFLISFKNCLYNFDEHILHIHFAGCGSGSGACLSVASGFGLCFEVLFWYFLGNSLLLKLHTFSLALRNNLA